MQKIKLIPILILFSLMACKNKQKVELIITDATIYTVNNQFDIKQSVAVNKGKIVDVGSSDEILNNYTSDNTKSYKGKFIYPGFIDAHSHFYGYGQLVLKEVDLSETKSYNEIIERLTKFQEKHNFDWLEGSGWDENDWTEKQFPTKEKLDKAFPNTPVYLTRIDGHAALVNSKALEIAGITSQTKIEGGEIILENNEPSGVLIDNAMPLVSKIIPKLSKEKQIQAFMLAQKNCFEVGLTGVCDAGLNKDLIMLIDSLQKTGDLKMRIYAMLNPTEENFEHFVKKGVYKTERLTVSSIKLYADGALGSRGAKMKQPYTDKPNYTGLLVEEPDYFDKMAKYAYENNYQLNTHCIGDSAVELILKTYGKYLKGKNDRRWRIEHAQIVADEDFDLFGKYSVIPSVQATHATSDMYWAETRIGNRIKNAYAFKQLLAQNGWLPNGTDFPIEKINPVLTFYAAVSRKDMNLFPENGFQPENALSREETLKSMTIWAAKAAFEENEKGSIEKGKFADFVVFNKDLMIIPVNEIFKQKPVQTIVNGELVFAE